MSWIEIHHEMTYRYATPGFLGPHKMMVRPRETRELRLLSLDLDIAPVAHTVWSTDVAGNAVADATFEGASDVLVIAAKMVVDLTAPVWPVFPIAANAVSFPFAYQIEDAEDLGPLAVPQYRDDGGRLDVSHS